MGLTDMLGRIAVRHAHVLVAEVPGHWVTRAAVERQVLARGWRLALSPGEADIVAVCGSPLPQLTEPLAQMWEQLPGPRTRIEIDSPHAVLPAFDTAEANLLDTTLQRADSRERLSDRAGTVHAGGEHHHHERHAPHDRAIRHPTHPNRDRREDGGQRSGTGHDLHADDGMGHGGMDMTPGGIPLAAGGEDRDGLEMDLLHLRLGPVLAYWPAGLVLRCTLQGDVIVDAQVTLLAVDNPADLAAAGPLPAMDERCRFAARRCDNLTSLLALAGWDDAASRARRIRDALLFTDDVERPVGELHRLRRKIGRSWLLRWGLRRIGPLEAPELARRGLPDTLAGDVHDRLLAMLDRAADSIAGQHPIGQPRDTPIAAIPDVVRGWDLATARLLIASLDLDPLAADREVSHA